MSIDYGFKHDTQYGADDVNEAFARLFTGGKLAHKTNVTEDITGCTGSITDGGVIGDSLKVSATESGIVIGEGAGIFADGSWVTVDEYGCVIVADELEEKYIGFVKSVGTGMVEPIITNEKLEDNENYFYIWLSYVNNDGAISGVQNIAKSKLTSNAPNTYVTKKLSGITVHSSNSETCTLDVGREGFRYLLFKINSLSAPNVDYNVVDLDTYDERSVYVGVGKDLTGIISVSGSLVTIEVHGVGHGTTYNGVIEMMAV